MICCFNIVLANQTSSPHTLFLFRSFGGVRDFLRRVSHPKSIPSRSISLVLVTHVTAVACFRTVSSLSSIWTSCKFYWFFLSVWHVFDYCPSLQALLSFLHWIGDQMVWTLIIILRVVRLFLSFSHLFLVELVRISFIRVNPVQQDNLPNPSTQDAYQDRSSLSLYLSRILTASFWPAIFNCSGEVLKRSTMSFVPEAVSNLKNL